MATTLQSIISTIRNGSILPPVSVNYGYTDGLVPPYISVHDFETVRDYDTCGGAIQESTFTVVCIDRTPDDAEIVAQRVLGLLDLSTTITDKTMGCFVLNYKVGQIGDTSGPALYQYGVEMKYRLKESVR